MSDRSFKEPFGSSKDVGRAPYVPSRQSISILNYKWRICSALTQTHRNIEEGQSVGWKSQPAHTPSNVDDINGLLSLGTCPPGSFSNSARKSRDMNGKNSFASSFGSCWFLEPKGGSSAHMDAGFQCQGGGLLFVLGPLSHKLRKTIGFGNSFLVVFKQPTRGKSGKCNVATLHWGGGAAKKIPSPKACATCCMWMRD